MAKFGFKLKTRLSFDELDNVLGQYCRAPYALHVGGLDDSGSVRRKVMVLMFDDVEDRDRIKLLFARRKSGMMPGAAGTEFTSVTTHVAASNTNG